MGILFFMEGVLGRAYCIKESGQEIMFYAYMIKIVSASFIQIEF